MCVCMYVCMYACIYVCMYVCIKLLQNKNENQILKTIQAL